VQVDILGEESRLNAIDTFAFGAIEPLALTLVYVALYVPTHERGGFVRTTCRVDPRDRGAAPPRFHEVLGQRFQHRYDWWWKFHEVHHPTRDLPHRGFLDQQMETFRKLFGSKRPP
jgi:hypothetical protein